MSIDIDLVINTGVEETVVEEVGNYTHNCQGMWTLALHETGCEKGLCDFDGLLASAAIALLSPAVDYMFAPEHHDTFTLMNPKNGWGNFESARDFLQKFLRDCQQHPLCTIRTSC
jgi:hypothetical protein